jgi:hypothetical protein
LRADVLGHSLHSQASGTLDLLCTDRIVVPDDETQVRLKRHRRRVRNGTALAQPAMIKGLNGLLTLIYFQAFRTVASQSGAGGNPMANMHAQSYAKNLESLEPLFASKAEEYSEEA